MILPVTLSPIQNIKHISFKSMPAQTMQVQNRKMPPIYTKTVVASPVSTIMSKSQNSYNLFKAKLDTIFFDCTRTENRNPQKAFGTIEYNKSKYLNGINVIPAMRFKTGVDAKRFINENNLISARIILDNGTKAEGNRALTRLQKAIKDGKIIVTEISQFGVNDNTDYASNAKLNSILEESNKAGYGCTKFTNRKANGYHSIVAKLRLEDGFTGTLEIMGKEVAKLKDVEEILHSMENEMPVDNKYDALKEKFDNLTPEQRSDLKKYTKAAYISARSDEMFGTQSKGFIPLTNENLPKCFDFNYISKI